MACSSSGCKMGLRSWAATPSCRQRTLSPARWLEFSMMMEAPQRLGSSWIACAKASQAGGDAETESGASESARSGAIDLGESIKDFSLLFQGDADTCIGNAEMQANMLGGVPFTSHANHDFALMGELDGIAEEVEQDLS